MSLSSCWQNKKNVNFGHAKKNSTSKGKMEVCESCPLSNTIDGHRCHVFIFLLTKVITKRRIILDMQFLISH